MSPKSPLLPVFLLALGFSACSQESEEQETSRPAETAEQIGQAEQIGRKIDQAVVNIQQQAKEAESRVGDKLIEAGKALKEKQKSELDQQE